MRNAKYWISGNRNCDGVDILNSLENVDGPAVAVADMGNQYGHVIFIEKVVRNEDGKIRELYISESNGWVSDNEFSNNHRYDEGKDGIVQKVSPETFYRRYRGLLGYIVPKRQ